MSAGPSCARCGAALGAGVNYCGRCGAVTREHRATVRARMQTVHSLERRHIVAVAIVFVGTLAGLVGVPQALAVDAHEGLVAASTFAAQICAGLAALAVLGRGSVRAAFAGAPRARDVLLAVPVGALAFAIAYTWVELVLRPSYERIEEFLEAIGVRAEEPVPELVLAVVVGAPLVEEWLCRGVLWRALAPLTTPRGQIVVSAALFALLHGLGGGFVLEFPHRFAGGLALGWLRARSGSLVPSIIAHMTWNALAVWSAQ